MLEGLKQTDIIQDIHYERSNILLLNLDISNILTEGRDTHKEAMCLS